MNEIAFSRWVVLVTAVLLARVPVADAWERNQSLSLAGASFVGEGGYNAAGCATAGPTPIPPWLLGVLVAARRRRRPPHRQAPHPEPSTPRPSRSPAPRSARLAVILAAFILPPRAIAWELDTPIALAGASFVGEVDGDDAGQSVARAGDVDGDGLDDLLVGAPENDEAGEGAGQVYLLLGSAGGWAPGTSLSSAHASFLGEGGHEGIGDLVTGVGDLDGDGLDEFMVAPNESSDGGEGDRVYLVLGRSSGWSMDTPLSSADASFIVFGRDRGGVAGGGDVDGDGYGDVLIGDPVAWCSPGQVFLVSGGARDWTLDTSLSTTDAVLVGDDVACDAGASVAIARNLDGDEFADIVVSAWTSDGGGVYVVYGNAGPWDAPIPIALADASFTGESSGDGAGSALAAAGDVNGDGLDDLLVAASGNEEGGADAGKAYLLLGREGGWSGSASLSSADASFVGNSKDAWMGYSLAGAVDVDGDGYDDFLIGTPGCHDAGTYAGQVSLVLGRATGWSLDTPLSAVDATFPAEAENDNLGKGLAGIGDMDGDGLDGFLIGAPGNYAGGPGKAYLVTGEIGCSYADQDVDGDGWTVCEGDCRDLDATVHPGAPEACDGLDSDCRDDLEWTEEDIDGDGWARCEGDCDDGRCDTYPGAEEDCDWNDDDCDGEVDEGVKSFFYADADGDGYGDAASPRLACDATGSFVADDTDCDDTDPSVHPGAPETCDGVDDDCDGDADAGAALTWYPDADRDGWGDPTAPVEACDPPSGTVTDATDCDDDDATVHPGASETCDGVDDDCDGAVDDGAALTWYPDADGDGWGDPTAPVEACDPPSGTVADATDCDDLDAAVHPGADEVPGDGIDQDCDGSDPGSEDTGVTGGKDWGCATPGRTSSPWLLALLAGVVTRRRRSFPWR